MEKIDIALLFRNEMPIHIESKNGSHGDSDFREVLFIEYEKSKLVIKLADNAFTNEERLNMWEIVSNKYRKLGYYCPRFFKSLDGTFPRVIYNGHNCIAWAEEYSIYNSAYKLIENNKNDELKTDDYYPFLKDIFLMNARVASMHYDFTDLPSAYCMFEIFDSNDKIDETMLDALKWKEEADKLPEKFKNQVNRIWNNWLMARKELKQIYSKLPTSVFQADCNVTNILLDDNNHFIGVYDFNIAGKEVYVNLLVREAPYISKFDDNRFDNKDYYLNSIKNALKISAEVYQFNELEKKAIPLLYKCIRPLYWHSTDSLKKALNDDMIQKCLDYIELEQIRNINFFE